jgi:squalene synthase HpnC
MPIDHYENFPVASLLLPRRLRQPVSVIYRFARSADDIADEGDASASERLDALRGYALQLERIRLGLPALAQPAPALFTQLAQVIERHSLDIQPFRDLLSAFSQDAVTTRYETFERVLDYCSRSANPVGRIMLALYRADRVQYQAWSDQICTALQLINFWQDVAVDLAHDRVYLPAEDLQRFGLEVHELSASVGSQRWRELMAFECQRARDLMLAGAPLVGALRGRVALELRFVVQGGLRILEKIEAAEFDVFNRRPVLVRSDWIGVAARALTMRP